MVVMDNEIIEQFVKRRKKLKISQVQLSEQTGIVQPSISRFEQGKHSFSIKYIKRLLKPLGYDIKVSFTLIKNEKN